MHPADLPQLIADARTIGGDTEQRFGQLAPDRIHTQPAPGEWSAGQCLEHLIRSNRSYFPAFEALARGEYRAPLLARLPVLPGLWGRLIFHVVRPEATRRIRTPRRFDPQPDAVAAGVVGRFLDTQTQLIDLMTRLRDANAERLTLVSPFAGFATYSVLDACRIIVAHERRHLAQAERALSRSTSRDPTGPGSR